MKFKSINQNKLFIRAYRKGVSMVTPLVVTYVMKNRYGHIRIGITSSKKIGGAVQRNRARRVIRAAIRAINLDMNQGYDIILVARSKTTRCKSWQLEPLIRKRLTDAGVIHDKENTDFSDQTL